MSVPLRALVVEDSEDDAFLLVRHLQRGGYQLDWLRVETEDAMRAALKNRSWDIVFSDYSLPHFNGLEALRVLRASGIGVPAILVSGAIGEEIAVEAMKSGAQDYVLKDNLTRLVPSVDRALREASNLQARGQAEAALKESQSQLLAETRQRLEELDRLNRISNQLRSAITSQEILPVFFAEVTSALASPHAAILLYHEDVRQLEAVTVGGSLAEFQSYRVSLRPEVQRFLLEDGSLFCTEDIHSQDVPFEKDFPETIGPVLVIPMHAAEAVIGLFILARERDPQGGPTAVYSANDISLIKTLADLGGSALQRAQLFEQTQQRMQRLSVLHAIDMAVSGSLSLTITLNLILDQIVSQLAIDAADMLLHHAQSHTLNFTAGRGFKNERVKRAQFRLGQSIPGKVVLDRKSFLLNDLASDPALLKLHYLEDEPFTSYFAIPLIIKGQIKGVLELFSRAPFPDDLELRDFLESLAAQAAIAIDNNELFDDLKRSNRELTRAYDAIIGSWSRSLEYKTPLIRGHTLRVTDLAISLALILEVPETNLPHIRRGALLHDIGLVSVSDAVLQRPDPTVESDRQALFEHPNVAYELIAGIDFLRPALDIPYCHHEAWDGSGYPRGLKGEDIPLAARIFAVVDAWDELSMDMENRSRWPHDRIIQYLRSQAGRQFDPVIVDRFIAELPKLLAGVG